MGRKSTPLFLSLFTTLILPHWSHSLTGERKRGAAAAAADCDSWPKGAEQNNARYTGPVVGAWGDSLLLLKKLHGLEAD